MTSASGRRVAIDGVTNMRDLGGLPTIDGREIVRGQIFRAEAMAAAGVGEVYAVHDDGMAERLEPLNLRAIVDLRTELECESVPCLWAPTVGAELINIPIREGAPGSDTDIFAMLIDGRLSTVSDERFGQFYLETLERRAQDLGQAISVIAETERRPILVHCTGGKDRTGIVVALLLDVLGVPDELIIDDYTETGRNRPDRVLHYERYLAGHGLTVDDARALFETPHATMQRMLDHVRSEYGTSEEYLVRWAGVPSESIDRLRAELLISR